MEKSLQELQAEDTEQRKQWLDARKEGVGASEAAGVLGVSPWSSPLSVYADKTLDVSKEFDDATVERFRWGHILERVILDELTVRTGLEFRRAPQHKILKHRNFDVVPMFATPDAYILGENASRLCQVKTSNIFAGTKWDDGIPIDVNVQTQHEMAVCDREGEIVVTLIGGQKLVWFEVDRHQTFIDQLEPEISRFWFDHVLPRRLPPADGSTATANALERLHPDDTGKEIVLDEKSVVIDEELKDIKSDLAKLNKRKQELENEIKAMLGDATFGKLPNNAGRFSWKSITRKAFSVKENTFKTLRRGK